VTVVCFAVTPALNARQSSKMKVVVAPSLRPKTYKRTATERRELKACPFFSGNTLGNKKIGE